MANPNVIHCPFCGKEFHCSFTLNLNMDCLKETKAHLASHLLDDCPYPFFQEDIEHSTVADEEEP